MKKYLNTFKPVNLVYIFAMAIAVSCIFKRPVLSKTLKSLEKLQINENWRKM